MIGRHKNLTLLRKAQSRFYIADIKFQLNFGYIVGAEMKNDGGLFSIKYLEKLKIIIRQTNGLCVLSII